MSVIHGLPFLEPYGNPIYFIYLFIALIPVIIALLKGKRLVKYEFIFNLSFLLLMFGGEKISQLFAFIVYILWQTVCVFAYQNYRKKGNKSSYFYLTIFISLLPLILVKIFPFGLFQSGHSLFSFMGISYLTFKSIGIIIELRDGVLENCQLKSFLRFMTFFPTFSSGPIDRFRRFEEDYRKMPNKATYYDMLEKAIMYIMLGFLYKFILSYVIGSLLLPLAQAKSLALGGYFNYATVVVMYGYGLNLFFDFAGYSMFAIAISYIMGIKTPENFKMPFLSASLKEFWNRWHMTLSFWFRDFVYMRLIHYFIKNKSFKDRNVMSASAYIINMLLMGLWHGVTWYYIAYGLFHALGLIINDAWSRYKKKLNRKRKKEGKKALYEGKIFHYFSVFLTFHVVMLSLLLFSGFLNTLWFNNPLKQ